MNFWLNLDFSFSCLILSSSFAPSFLSSYCSRRDIRSLGLLHFGIKREYLLINLFQVVLDLSELVHQGLQLAHAIIVTQNPIYCSSTVGLVQILGPSELFKDCSDFTIVGNVVSS